MRAATIRTFFMAFPGESGSLPPVGRTSRGLKTEGFDNSPTLSVAEHGSSVTGDAVEHADFVPVAFVALDKGQMVRGRLVQVVRCARVENHVQGDVERAVVHGPRQFRLQRASGEKRDARMVFQVAM